MLTILIQCRLVSVWFVGTRTIAIRRAACLTQHSYFLTKRHWILITLFIVLSFLPKQINDINFLKDWKSEFIFYLLFTIGFFLFRYAYISEKETQLCKILSRLNIESNAIIVENIWSIKDIIVRFIYYPFSFFLLNCGIPLIFSTNNNKSILTGVFLYAEAKIILYASPQSYH